VRGVVCKAVEAGVKVGIAGGKGEGGVGKARRLKRGGSEDGRRGVACGRG